MITLRDKLQLKHPADLSPREHAIKALYDARAILSRAFSDGGGATAWNAGFHVANELDRLVKP